MKKIWPCRYGTKFQIWGQQISGDFMVPNDTEQTTEDILSVWDWVNNQKFQIYWEICEFGLLNTFHQLRLGKQQFFLDSSEKTVMTALQNSLGEFMVPNDTVRTTVTRGLCSLWYYLVKYMTRS